MRRTWLLALVLAVVACAPVGRPEPRSPVALPADVAQMYLLVNEIRRHGHDCGPEGRFGRTHGLRWSGELARAAERHARDLFVREKPASHQGSDGSDVTDRASDAGYLWAAVGENIAFGIGYVLEPEEAMEGWLASPGHCRNLLHPDFEELGIARVGEYWVQVFGRPRAIPSPRGRQQ